MILLISRFIPYDNIVVKSLSLQSFFKFLPYFIYGVSLNIIPEIKEKIESDNIIFSVSFISIFAFAYIGLNSTLCSLIVAFSYINVMVFFFRRTCNNRYNATVEYIAKRTLDIYLFHFFLLPAFVVEMPAVFNPDTNILITLVLIIVLSLIVLLGTLALTKFIEYSKILSFLMLGKRV